MADLFYHQPTSLDAVHGTQASAVSTAEALGSAQAQYQRLFGTVQDAAAADNDTVADGTLADQQDEASNFTNDPAQSTSEQIQLSIREALERRAERHIHHEAGGIKVDVKDGRVSLSGEVATWREKEAIIGAARHAPGIHAVEDHILIMPGS